MKQENVKQAFIVFVVIILSVFTTAVVAHEDVTAGENLVKSKAACSTLNNDQLEEIGEYYMEQMHPGEAHERMDELMGGEGSANLKQAHINLAKSFYCGERNAMPMSMMSTIMGGGSTGMMGTQMMGTRTGMQAGVAQAMGGLGMMGGSVSLSWTLFNFLYVLVVAFAVSVVFWLTYKLIINGKKEGKKR